MEDSEIVKLYLSRSEQAVAETQQKYEAYCLRIAKNILTTEEDALECVNDAYLKLWQTIPPAVPLSLAGYLGKTVRNLSLNRRRNLEAQKRGGDRYGVICDELTEDLLSPSVEEMVDEKLLRQTIARWLASQPKNKRMVFVGRYWYMDAVETIAAKMGYSVSKTKSLLLRLRKDLKEYLKGEGITV